MSSDNKILSRDETRLKIQDELIEAINAQIGKSEHISFIEASKRMTDDEILERYPTIYVLTVKISKTGKPSVNITVNSSKVILTSGGLMPSTRQYMQDWGKKAASTAIRFFERDNIKIRKIIFYLLPDAMKMEFKIPNILLENITLVDDYTGKTISVEEYLDEKTMDDSDYAAANDFLKNSQN